VQLPAEPSDRPPDRLDDARSAALHGRRDRAGRGSAQASRRRGATRRRRRRGGESRVTTDGFTKARTVARLADEIARALDDHGIAEPMSESREIVAALFDVPRFWSLTNGHVEVNDAIRARAERAIERRALGAPMAYAVGRAPFRHLTLEVDERVLIP